MAIVPFDGLAGGINRSQVLQYRFFEGCFTVHQELSRASRTTWAQANIEELHVTTLKVPLSRTPTTAFTL